MIEIVGNEEGSHGRLCEEHDVSGCVVDEDVVVCLWKVQVLVDGMEETGQQRCLIVLSGGGILQPGNRFDGSAGLHTSPIPQSTSDCVGLGGIDRGIVWQLRFQ